jgi:hypothetical protein
MVADENFECLQSGLPASSCPALWRAMLLLSKINQIVLLLYAIRGPPLHKIMLPPRDFFVLAIVLSWVAIHNRRMASRRKLGALRPLVVFTISAFERNFGIDPGSWIYLWYFHHDILLLYLM